ncbi:MAG: Eco57I restriction-modification methylase domain-containing protein, partial [Promethearchaeota archaeon]
SDTTEKFDLIIGNPPYLGQNYNAQLFQEYVKKFPICTKYFVGNMDLFYYFIHLGIDKLNPGGLLSYITTNYWITKSQKTGIKLLKPHILNECYLLQYVDLSPLKLFKGARGQHNCIIVLQKKTKEEKINGKNKDIHVVQVLGENGSIQKAESYTKEIFKNLLLKKSSEKILQYTSALTNSDLSHDGNWNLLYSNEIKSIVDKIENYCKTDGLVLRLKDFFIIRNGLILINDKIFILREGKQIKVQNDDFYIQVNEKFIKLNEIEKTRLKKVYKSKSIRSFGFDNDSYTGYGVYFNKNQFQDLTHKVRNEILEDKYPVLTSYIKQFEPELRAILLNAKENPNDIYFPRRGSFIKTIDNENKQKLRDLEPFYDNSQKIFFKFISEKNIFGYSNKSYYATSDTYFLWPKNLENSNLDYLFILAYLNSKLVFFLYKAKNIEIKRSKTKLEQGLPIPDLKAFKTKEKIAIIKIIKIMTSFLVNNSQHQNQNGIVSNLSKLIRPESNFSASNVQFLQKALKSIKRRNKKEIKIAIDALFFQLFDLDEDVVKKLLKKYYSP